MVDLDGHLTHTHLLDLVQHVAVPEPMRPENWQLERGCEGHCYAGGYTESLLHPPM